MAMATAMECCRHACALRCVLSALAGSALTFVVLRLRRRRQMIQRRGRDGDGESQSHGNNTTKAERHDDGVEGENCGDRGAFAERRRASGGSGPDGCDGTSFSGAFDSVDGRKRTRDRRGGAYDFDRTTDRTDVAILSEERDFLSDDEDVVAAREFDERVLSLLTSLDASKLLLHRTRAVAALASRLMAAPDEESCYDVASRLIVPLFRVDRCAYALMKDADHVIVKNVAVRRRRHATYMGLEGRQVVKPLRNTMVGLCAATLRQQYCPRTRESRFQMQRKAHAAMGINTILATPILVNRNRFAGAIVISMAEEDAFAFHDRVLIQDIANMLGAIIYAKRMRRVAERSNKISREMLHSMIPPQVIENIEVFWDENSEEYQSQRNCLTASSFTTRNTCSLDSSIGTSSNGWTKENQKEGAIDRRDSVCEFLNQISTINNNNQNAGIVIDKSEREIGSLSRALYADNVNDVVIVVTDIVGFSYLATVLSAMEIMNIVQALFGRFDALCDKWGVRKLETVGDAYLVTANLMDDHENAKDAATSALNMAKDMIRASREVVVPGKSQKSLFETLQIRVGMHVGNVTCGVLGERLPKFSLFGNTINVAARMEQAGKPNKIRVSKAFKSLIDDVFECDWGEYEVISMKNMGDIGTYIFDPFLQINDNLQNDL